MITVDHRKTKVYEMKVLLYTAVFASVLFHCIAQLNDIIDPLWLTHARNDDSRGVVPHSGPDNTNKGRDYLDQTERGSSESSLENGYTSDRGEESSYTEETSDESSSYTDESDESSSYTDESDKSSSYTDESDKSSSYTDESDESSSYTDESDESSSYTDESDESSQENSHSLTSNEFVGSCTKSDYREWYRDEFPNECKDTYSNSNHQIDLMYSLYCDSDCGDTYSDFLRSCGEEGELYASYYDSLCWTNERGVPCFLFLGSFQDSNPKEAVEEKCLPYNGSCSSNCHRALEYFSFKLGCCINNIYNTSVPGDVVQYMLWSSCGVNTPDFCENAHSENIGLTLTVVKPLILAIIFVIATLMF